ncbi:rodlin [Streptomyces sp. NPDC048484]|uniref:rodlin n=1 Tax=Streptomyces sp. NPDC048484 TaxID=3155146 RepID=UPI003427E775
MLKKAMATAAVAVSVVGFSAAGATQALAIGNGDGVSTANGNKAAQIYGNAKTHGKMSPQGQIVQGSLNKPCVGLPAKGNLASIVGWVPVAVLQDVPVLSAPQDQQCSENSTQAKGDEPLSHILASIPVG